MVIFRFQQGPYLVAGVGVGDLPGNIPDGGDPGLVLAEGYVQVDICRRGRDLHELDQKVLVIVAQNTHDGNRVYRGFRLKQLADSLVHREAWAVVIRLGRLKHDLRHNLRGDEHGAQDAVLRFQPLAAVR